MFTLAQYDYQICQIDQLVGSQRWRDFLNSKKKKNDFLLSNNILYNNIIKVQSSCKRGKENIYLMCTCTYAGLAGGGDQLCFSH